MHDRRFVGAFAAQPPSGPGWRVGVVALDGSPLAGLPAGAVPVASLARASASAPAVDRVRDAVRQFQPDVVVAGPLQAATLPAVQAAAVPVVAISWAFDLLADAAEPEGRREAQEALAGAAALLCDARAVAQSAEALGMPAAKITIAPWGVDLGRFKPGTASSIRASLSWNSQLMVLSARNLEPLYRLDTVIEAFAIAAAQVPKLRLAILGDGTLRPALEQRARAGGLDERLHFAGRINLPVLPAWFAAADMYVSASPVDGSSVSLMEAMASGLPAIVSDIPGNREWIEPDTTGWLFPVGDAQAMASALVACAQMTPDEQRGMGRAARAIAEARADWTVNSRRITDAVAAVASG